MEALDQGVAAVRWDDELLDLPGPRQFWRRITDAVDAGVSVGIVCPTREVADALEAVAIHWRQLRRWELVLTEIADFMAAPAPIYAAYDVLGLERPQPGVRADPHTLLQDEAAARRIVWVDATTAQPDELEAWWRFVQKLGAAAKSVSLERRCVFVTTFLDPPLTAGDAEDTSLAIWWWGVLGQIDAATWLMELGGEALDPAAADCLVETGKFDLDLVEQLLLGGPPYWYGDITAVQHLLRAYAAERNLPAALVPADGRAHGPRPPPQLVEAWRAGAVESWGGSLTMNAAVAATQPGGRDQLAITLWRGQLSSLLPEIERHRQQLAQWVSEQVQRCETPFPDLSWSADFLELEIGALAHLTSRLHDAGAATAEQRSAAHLLRLARNDLAHLRPIPRSRLEELHGLHEGIWHAD